MSKLSIKEKNGKLECPVCESANLHKTGAKVYSDNGIYMKCKACGSSFYVTRTGFKYEGSVI